MKSISTSNLKLKSNVTTNTKPATTTSSLQKNSVTSTLTKQVQSTSSIQANKITPKTLSNSQTQSNLQTKSSLQTKPSLQTKTNLQIKSSSQTKPKVSQTRGNLTPVKNLDQIKVNQLNEDQFTVEQEKQQLQKLVQSEQQFSYKEYKEQYKPEQKIDQNYLEENQKIKICNDMLDGEGIRIQFMLELQNKNYIKAVTLGKELLKIDPYNKNAKTFLEFMEINGKDVMQDLLQETTYRTRDADWDSEEEDKNNQSSDQSSDSDNQGYISDSEYERTEYGDNVSVSTEATEKNII